MATGVELATAWLRIVPSVEGIQGGVAKALGSAEDEAEEVGKRSGKRFSGGAKAAMALGGAAAVTALVGAFNTGLQEIKFGEEINAQTETLIANSGFSGTVGEINDVTLALSKLSGISEEDLQSAGNNILKFGDVSEETYKRSVASINDLGGAGKDVAGVSEALGKALADPAAAAALLKRQGVLLNDEQKTMIETMTAAGDKAGAQGVILDALESSYGGMAEAAGGTMQGNLNKMGNAFENLAGDMVSLAMPAIEGIIGVMQGLIGFLQENQGVVIAIAAVIGVALVAAFIAWAASVWVATAALLANPITWIILAIVALIAAIVLLVMNWDHVVKFVTDIWSAFMGWIRGVISGFVGWWNGIWAAVGNFIRQAWVNIAVAVMNAWNGVQSWLQGVIGGFVSWWNGIWSGIGNIIRTVFSSIGSFIGGIWDGIVSTIKGAVNGIIRAINGMIGGLNDLLSGIGNLVGLNLSLPKIPGLANGGTVTRGGTVLVGERGPELLSLPRGASVNPNIPEGGGGMPRTLRLVVGDREFTAYVQEEAAGVVATANRPFRGGRR